MRRFFYQGILTDTITLSGQEAYHIINVLRIECGEDVIIVDDAKNSGKYQIIDKEKNSVQLKLLETIKEEKEAPIQIILGQGLPKGDKMEYIVQKAVELGAMAIVPLELERCVVQYSEDKKENRCHRWQKIAHEAAKQSGRVVIPAIWNIRGLSQLLEEIESDTAIYMFYEKNSNIHYKAVLQKDTHRKFLVLIGPEGGFTSNEVAIVEKKGGHVVSLGPRILRTETAGLAALATMMYEQGDLGG